MGYMTVSDVGRTAIGFSSSDCPLRVTHATSGANPSTWSFSAVSARSDTNSGKYAFSTPSLPRRRRRRGGGARSGGVEVEG